MRVMIKEIDERVVADFITRMPGNIRGIDSTGTNPDIYLDDIRAVYSNPIRQQILILNEDNTTLLLDNSSYWKVVLD